MRTQRNDAGELVSSGRFADALSCLESNPQPSTKYELLLAEVLLRLGAWEDTTSRLERIIAKERGNAKAVALGLRAELHGYRAETAAAEAEFRHAIQLAIGLSNRELACFLRIRMLAFVGEVYSDARSQRIADEARDEALALGEEKLLAAYHVMAAKCDATQGRLRAACAHEQLALEHLRKAPNSWIAAGLTLTQSGTAFMMSDLAAALQYARAAEQEAIRSGDLWSRAAAAANLGFLHLYVGDFDRAETQLTFARELGKRLPVLQIGTLDTWAQLCLVRNLHHEAANALEEVGRTIDASPALRGSWYELGSKITRVRLHRLAEDWQGVFSEASAGATLARGRADENATAVFFVQCRRSLAALRKSIRG